MADPIVLGNIDLVHELKATYPSLFFYPESIRWTFAIDVPNDIFVFNEKGFEQKRKKIVSIVSDIRPVIKELGEFLQGYEKALSSETGMNAGLSFEAKDINKKIGEICQRHYDAKCIEVRKIFNVDHDNKSFMWKIENMVWGQLWDNKLETAKVLWKLGKMKYGFGDAASAKKIKEALVKLATGESSVIEKLQGLSKFMESDAGKEAVNLKKSALQIVESHLGQEIKAYLKTQQGMIELAATISTQADEKKTLEASLAAEIAVARAKLAKGNLKGKGNELDPLRKKIDEYEKELKDVSETRSGMEKAVKAIDKFRELMATLGKVDSTKLKAKVDEILADKLAKKAAKGK